MLCRVRARVVVFDLDGTLLREGSATELLARSFGHPPALASMMERYRRGMCDNAAVAAERHAVRHDHPLEVGLSESKIGLDRRDRDVHDREVEDDHELNSTHQRQDDSRFDPTAAF